jgi:hypothetical protein
MPCRRTATAVATAVLLLTALTGCGQDSAGKGSGTTDGTVTTGPSDVTEMKKLVDAAESAAAAAESAAAEEGQD